jgi:hypothetical protein
MKLIPAKSIRVFRTSLFSFLIYYAFATDRNVRSPKAENFAVPSELGPRSISLRSTEPDFVSLGPLGNDRFRESKCRR